MKSALGIMAAGVLCLPFLSLALPRPARPAAKSTHEAQIAHGEYLVKDIAGCADCHTPLNEKGQPIPGLWLKGSKLSSRPLVPFPGWADASPKIAGLEGWDTEKAIHLLMTGTDPSGHRPRPPMPQYRMNPTDAAAVVAYLKSLK